MASALNSLNSAVLNKWTATFEFPESFDSEEEILPPAEDEPVQKAMNRAMAGKHKAPALSAAKMIRRDQVVLEHLPW